MAVDWGKVGTGKSSVDWGSFSSAHVDSSQAPQKRMNVGQSVRNFIGGIGNSVKSYLDHDKNGKISLGEVGSAAKKLPGQAYDTMVKPAVDTVKQIPGDLEHGAKGVGIAVKSMATGERGAQLAQSKRQAADELNKTSFKKLNLVDKSKINNSGTYTGPKDAGADVRRIAGKTAEDALNIGLPGKGKAVLKLGQAAVEQAAKKGVAKTALKLMGKGALEGAKYGAATGGAQAAQDEAPTLHSVMSHVVGGAAVGAAAGGALGPAGAVAAQASKKVVSLVSKNTINDATRSAIVHELIQADEKDAAEKAAKAQTPQDVATAVEGTRFHPEHNSPNDVSIPVEKQNINPSEGDAVHEVAPRQDTTQKITELEQALKEHPKAPPLAVDAARTVARRQGMDNERYAQLLQTTLEQADNLHNFQDNAKAAERQATEAPAKTETKQAQSDDSALAQNEKNAQQELLRKQTTRGGGLEKPELPGMDKYRARQEQYLAEHGTVHKNAEEADMAALDQQRQAPDQTEIERTDRNAVAPQPKRETGPVDVNALLGQNTPGTKVKSEETATASQTAAEARRPKEDVAQPSDAAPVNDRVIDPETGEVVAADPHQRAVEQRDAMVSSLDEAIGHLDDAMRAKGVDPTEFARSLHRANRGKGEVADQGLYEAHQHLIDRVREINAQYGIEYGEQDFYFPEQVAGKQRMETSNAFDTTFDFGQTRTGALDEGNIDFNYRDVMHNWAVQTADNIARVEQKAAARGVSVERIIADNKIATDIATAARNDRLNKLDLIDRLHQADIDEARRQGMPPPELTLVNEGINGFEKYLRDGWSNLKGAGVWDDVFEPLARAAERAAFNFTEHFKGGEIKTVDQALEAFKKSGITDAETLGKIRRDLTVTLKSGGNAEALVLKTLKNYEKARGQQVLTEWLRTHKIADEQLRSLINRHGTYLLARDAVVPSLARKATNFITGRVYKAALGLNVRSAMNQALEAKRTLASVGIARGTKHILQAIGSDEYRKKYGIGHMGVEEHLNLIRSKDKRLYEALRTLDDKQMFMFMKGEDFKNELVLRAGEADGRRKNLSGDELFQHTMHYFEKNAHVYGQFGTVGVYDKNWAKLLGQFGQYAIKDLGLTADMALKVAGKGKATDPTTRREALAYLTRITMLNSGIYVLGSAAIGMGVQEVFGGPNVSGGPLVNLLTDLYTGAQDEFAAAQQEGRMPDLTKVVSRSGKRAVAGTIIPSGNQLINKTGVQALLADNNPIKKTFRDGALMDMERGYNESKSGNARFLAPQNDAERAKAAAFGPYSTKNSQAYFGGGGKALGSKQTQELNATDDQQGLMNKITLQRQEKASEKKTQQANDKQYGGKRTVAKTTKIKTRKARKVRVSVKHSGRTVRAKRHKVAKSKTVKLGLK
jgi:hypothetical protein